jgi:hypothetical protein
MYALPERLQIVVVGKVSLLPLVRVRLEITAAFPWKLGLKMPMLSRRMLQKTPKRIVEPHSRCAMLKTSAVG